MKKYLSIIIVFFLSISLSYANHPIILLSQKIKPKYNKDLSGTYPQISDKNFYMVNSNIKKFISNQLDVKGEEFRADVSFDKYYQDHYYLSFSINYNMSTATERYFIKPYTIDLINKKEVSLNEILEKYKVSNIDLENSLKEYIQPCFPHNKDRLKFAYCDDIAIQSLIDHYDEHTFEVSRHDGFYFINKHQIGIGFSSVKFTSIFIYDLNSRKIIEN